MAILSDLFTPAPAKVPGADAVYDHTSKQWKVPGATRKRAAAVASALSRSADKPRYIPVAPAAEPVFADDYTDVGHAVSGGMHYPAFTTPEFDAEDLTRVLENICSSEEAAIGKRGQIKARPAELASTFSATDLSSSPDLHDLSDDSAILSLLPGSAPLAARRVPDDASSGSRVSMGELCGSKRTRTANPIFSPVSPPCSPRAAGHLAVPSLPDARSAASSLTNPFGTPSNPSIACGSANLCSEQSSSSSRLKVPAQHYRRKAFGVRVTDLEIEGVSFNDATPPSIGTTVGSVHFAGAVVQRSRLRRALRRLLRVLRALAKALGLASR
ncbi:uncharacterized protein V1510DRAFT_405172 [Dipodascopsis tothii]|uniref:uncharacterized protein n=1 Tax=Dipodascopsis tothii TaxID=44089 RepID=UPI0034CDB405